MRNIFHHIFFILAALAAVNGHATAQKDSTNLNKEVEVIKPYRPTISSANKLNQLPVIEDTSRFTPEFKYTIENRPIATGFKTGPVSAQEIKTESDRKPGIGYIKAGAGIYNTTYGDFFLNNNKSKNENFGLRIRHLASDGSVKLSGGDKVDAPFSQNEGEIFGNVNIGGAILSGNFLFDRNVFRFYGYPDTIPASFAVNPPNLGLKQRLQKARFQTGIRSDETTQKKLEYKGNFWYQFFDTKSSQQEKAVGISGNFDYQFDKFNVLLETSYEHYTTKGILNNNENKRSGWYILSPSILFSKDKLALNGGINLYSATENVGDGYLKIYPKIDFSYSPVIDRVTVYAGINGYLQNSSYSAVAYENFWVNPVHNVRNADHQYIFTGGIKGKIINELAYNLGVQYEKVNDIHFFVFNSIAPAIFDNAFDVIYDDMTILNLSAELSYIKERDYSIRLKGNYYNYTPFALAYAPHIPQFEIEASSEFRITEKLSGFSDFKITGKRNALIKDEFTGDKNISLDPIYLLNIGADYKLKPKFNVFGRVDNLLHQRYEQWLGYNSQGLRLIAGVSVSF